MYQTESLQKEMVQKQLQKVGITANEELKKLMFNYEDEDDV